MPWVVLQPWKPLVMFFVCSSGFGEGDSANRRICGHCRSLAQGFFLRSGNYSPELPETKEEFEHMEIVMSALLWRIAPIFSARMKWLKDLLSILFEVYVPSHGRHAWRRLC